MDVDELVAVCSTLFVPEAGGMHEFMKNDANIDTSFTYGDWLRASSAPHSTAASEKQSINHDYKQSHGASNQ